MTHTSIYELDIQKNKELFHPYQIDCNACSGLCCVALFFSKTDGFPENKSAGVPCKNLMPDYRCHIHSTLSQKKMKGCLSYDCIGAGQIITQKMHWDKPVNMDTPSIFEAFLNAYHLQQILFYLTQAMVLQPAKDLKSSLLELIFIGKTFYEKDLNTLLAVDIDAFGQQANKILKEISNNILLKYQKTNSTHKQLDYMGKNLTKKTLIGKDFSMSYLIAANLEGCDLYAANFLGADMRDVNIKNADLQNSIFLTQSQVNSAIGNANTKLPDFLNVPSSWNDVKS